MLIPRSGVKCQLDTRRKKGYRLPDGIQPGWLVPCRVGEWSDVERLEVLIGDNPRAGTIDNDAEKLSKLLCDLQARDTLNATGYKKASLEKLLDEVSKQKPKQRGRVVGALMLGGEPTGKQTVGKSRRRAEKNALAPEKSAIAEKPVTCQHCLAQFVPGANPVEQFLFEAPPPNPFENE